MGEADKLRTADVGDPAMGSQSRIKMGTQCQIQGFKFVGATQQGTQVAL